MGKILMLVVVAAIGWYCYDTGILTGLSNNFTPVPGKACELVGASNGKLYIAVSKDAITELIGVGEMASVEKMDDAEKLANLLRSGLGAELPSPTKATIKDNAWVTVHGAPFHVTEVKLEDGEYSGHEVWTKRENVVDTPVQQLFVKFR